MQPPIPYGLLTDLIEKREGKQIKVKMPDGTNFSMAMFTNGTNEDYLVHVINVLRITEKKGMAAEIKAAWLAICDIGKEMVPSSSRPTNQKKPRNSATTPLTSSRTFSKQRKSLRLQ